MRDTVQTICVNPCNLWLTYAGHDPDGLVKWEVNGVEQEGHDLDIGPEPPDLEPLVFRVKLLKSTGAVWDRFILVVCNRGTKTSFDNWHTHDVPHHFMIRRVPRRYVSQTFPAASSYRTPYKRHNKMPNGRYFFMPFVSIVKPIVSIVAKQLMLTFSHCVAATAASRRAASRRSRTRGCSPSACP